MDSVRFFVTGPFPLAVPNLDADQWCHVACRDRWVAQDEIARGLLGGHIHYDAETNSWTVPFAVPLIPIGQLSSAGVARLG